MLPKLKKCSIVVLRKVNKTAFLSYSARIVKDLKVLATLESDGQEINS